MHIHINIYIYLYTYIQAIHCFQFPDFSCTDSVLFLVCFGCAIFLCNLMQSLLRSVAELVARCFLLYTEVLRYGTENILSFFP